MGASLRGFVYTGRPSACEGAAQNPFFACNAVVAPSSAGAALSQKWLGDHLRHRFLSIFIDALMARPPSFGAPTRKDRDPSRDDEEHFN